VSEQTVRQYTTQFEQTGDDQPGSMLMCHYMRMHDVYLANRSMNSEKFEDFIRTALLPILRPFNWINSNSVVIMDHASIRHVEGVTDLMKNQAGVKFSSFL